MKKTLKEIADLLGVRIVGDPSIQVTGVSGIEEAKEGDITFLHDSKFESLLKETKASAIIIPDDFRGNISKPLLVAKNPSFVFLNSFIINIKLFVLSFI